MYQKSTVDEKWEIVKQNNRCRKCLRAHHTNSCKKPDGTTCDKCTRRHHRSLHNERVPLANSDQSTETLPSANESQEASNHNVQGETSVPAICPVQKVKIRGQNGNFTEALAMLDSGSNTSFISKNVVKKLGIRGPKTHLTMTFGGGKKKSEASEFLDITVVSNTELMQSLQHISEESLSASDLANLINDTFLSPMQVFTPFSAETFQLPQDYSTAQPFAATAHSVYRQLASINHRKASGPDSIPAWFLKEDADLLSDTVTDNINCSFAESRLPPS